jgi:hypothetical protein
MPDLTVHFSVLASENALNSNFAPSCVFRAKAIYYGAKTQCRNALINRTCKWTLKTFWIKHYLQYSKIIINWSSLTIQNVFFCSLQRTSLAQFLPLCKRVLKLFHDILIIFKYLNSLISVISSNRYENGTARFKKCKHLFEYQHLLLLRDIWW